MDHSDSHSAKHTLFDEGRHGHALDLVKRLNSRAR